MSLNNQVTQHYIDSLKRGVCTITFRKADGSDRVMRATLNEAHLPPRQDQTQMYDMTYGSGNAIRVWDVELGAWRSFLPNAVITFQQPLTNEHVVRGDNFLTE